MDDLFAKLSEILASDEGKKQIADLTASLGENGNIPDLSGLLSKTKLEEAPPEEQSGGFNLPDGLNMDTILKLGRVMSKLNTGKDDKNSRLIMALKPHLNSDHQRRADQAMQILKLLELLPVLKEGNLF